MLISFFLQTVTQANKNHYRTSKNMFKVSNKITIKTCGSNHSKVFLKIDVPKKFAKSLNNTYEKVHFW